MATLVLWRLLDHSYQQQACVAFKETTPWPRTYCTGLYGSPPAVAAIDAGLETSVAGIKYPGIDMISIGPTVQNVHSPDERLEIAGVPKVYNLIAATLGKMKDR